MECSWSMNFAELWRYFKQIQGVSGIQTKAYLTKNSEIRNRFSVAGEQTSLTILFLRSILYRCRRFQMSRLVGPAVSDSKNMWRSLLNSTEASTIFLQFNHDWPFMTVRLTRHSHRSVEGKINDWHLLHWLWWLSCWWQWRWWRRRR